MRTGFAAVAGLLLWTASALAQPAVPRDPRTFRTGVEAVEIDVRVVDAQGNAVTGLTRDDFEVFEDGVRQDIKALIELDVPIVPRAGDRDFEPDVQTNRVPFDGRLYVLVLDDLHTHPLHVARVKRAVRRFLDEHFAANDRAALVVTSGRSDMSQELTSSRSALLAALERFQGRKLRSSTLERMDQYYLTRDLRERQGDGRYDPVRDPLEFERGHNARMALDTVTNAARWLATVPARRKALLFVSEGIDYDIHNVFENREASAILTASRDAVSAAIRGNVTIYGIDPRGLTLGDDLMEIGGLPEDPSLNLGTGSMSDEVRRAQDSLRTLSDETGGFAIVNANDLGAGFDRIVRENSRYYVLGYEPKNGRADGRFRKVDVRVKRPGLTAVARRGYVAPRREDLRRAEATEDAAPELRALLESPIPVAGLPLASSIATFRGASGKASALVTLEVGSDALTFKESDGLHRDRVDTAVLALAMDGKTTGGEQRSIELRLKPETLAHVRQHGFRTLSRVELAPGRYQVRVAAREQNGGRRGSVVHDLVVPDYAARPIALSDLVLGSRDPAQALTTRPDPELAGKLFVPPTAARQFASGDTLTVLAEVYDNRTPGAEPLIVTTSVTAPDGAVAFRAEETIEAFAFEPTRKAWTHRLDIPLANLRPDEYRLRVAVKPRSQSSSTVSREVTFRVGQRSETTP